MNVGLARDCANLLDWLDGAQLVVRVHHANQRRVRLQSAANILWIDDAIGTNRQKRNVNAIGLQFLARVKHRMMLDCGRDYVPLSRRARGYTKNRKIIALGTAAREYNLGRLRTDQRRDGFARILDGLARPLP